MDGWPHLSTEDHAYLLEVVSRLYLPFLGILAKVITIGFWETLVLCLFTISYVSIDVSGASDHPKTRF